MSTIKIKGATLFTMVEGEAPYEGDLLIKDSRIAGVGPSIAEEAKEIVDGRGMIAMPGLVNAHQHSPMSLLRAFSDDLKLLDWLERKMLPAEGRMTPEDIYWGAKLAIAEMIKSGTTAFADMYIHMNEIAEAVKETGIRASLTRGVIGLEDDGGRRMAEAADLIDRWHGQADGRITTMVGPHAPYTCPPHFMKEALTLAADKRVPVHTHLAETVEEIAKIREKYNCTPTEYLADTGILSHSHVLLAHAVHLTTEDVKLLCGIKGGVAHNPVSNLKLSCGIAPVVELLEQRICVGLGTDGAGSVTTLDMFEEIKAAAWLQKLRAGSPAAFTAGEALAMATIGGSGLLALREEIGTLETGKKADIILIDLRKPHLQPVHSMESLLAYSVNGADVDTTIVDGRILMRGRRLLTMDEEELLRQASVRVKRITEGV
ncbi:amidohydrolase [Paenibacillus sp. P96]|uniref:5-methylthioadenosine/S-adenosylhomocysteine deaminase n=1 Tax=Paenibacillus zeirhizosphaerae TaxID=2987519 RepID=A0ABT9FPY2_9BACL|nr:amidohydrolase [Paenibacillus sp. P96]MDP4096796.1 amidohydrolase [Paenibacillus sp. P96]